MLAHIRNDTDLIQIYRDDRGWVFLENGERVSPPTEGYHNGNDRVVAVQLRTIDNSTPGADETQSEISYNVTRTLVTIVTTISDVEISNTQINEERDRRIYEPKTVNLSTGKTFQCQMDGDGRANIGDLSTAAVAKIILGDNTTFSFRAYDNVDWTLTNQEIIEMGLQIMQQVENLHIKARVLKDMAPANRPKDFRNNRLWN